MEKIYLSPPHMGREERSLVQRAFDSNWIAPIGPHLDQFEKNMCDYIGVKNSCGVSSGTAALHLALKALSIGKGDVVLCPSLTFVATANSILYVDAQPVFLDSDSKSWVLDTSLLEDAIKRFKPKALITVDIYGQSCDYKNILDLCSYYGVFVIEDAAEALGSDYNDEKLGCFGKVGILSFNGNKIITTSSGGMILSNNEKIVEKCRYLSTQAREPVIHYEHKELGFNYRLSNILASVGIGQLSKIDKYVKKRRKIFKNYYNALSDIDGILFQEEIKNSRSNRWLTVICIDRDKTGFNRTKVMENLKKENIESRPIWKPMHLQPLFKDSIYYKRQDKDISSHLFKNGLCLPSGSTLSSTDQERIISIIISSLK